MYKIPVCSILDSQFTESYVRIQLAFLKYLHIFAQVGKLRGLHIFSKFNQKRAERSLNI